ncbi:MAG: pilus assembly protein PilM [Pseudomonadota bacterium]
MASFVPGFLKTKSSAAVSVGSGGVRGVRLTRTEFGVRLAAQASHPFPLDRPPHASELEDALLKTAGEVLGEKTKLTTNVRARDAGLHFFKPPFSRPDKTLRVLPYEAEPLFLKPVEEMVLDYLPLPPAETGELQGVVFGAEPAAAAAVLETMDLAGLDPNVILPDRLGLLLAGSYLFARAQEPRLRLILDLGAEQTGLALFDDDRPLLVRSFFYGGRNLTYRLAETLGLDFMAAERLKWATDLAEGTPAPAAEVLAEAWAPVIMEIERTLAGGLMGRTDPAEPALVLGGGGAKTPGLRRWLTGRLGLEVEFVSDYSAEDPDLAALGPDQVSVFGLALAALNDGYTPNLRQGDLAPSRIFTKYKVPLACGAVGLLLIFLINFGGLYFDYRAESRKYEQVKKEIFRVFRETVPQIKTVVEPLTQLRQEIEKARGSGAGYSPSSVRALDVLLDVSRLAGSHDGLRLTSLSLTPQALELLGEGGSYEVIDLFKTELTGLPYFSEALPGGARKDPTTGVLTFKISMRRKAG